MNLLVRRLFVRDESMFGVLAFEGSEAECFTLEDLPRPHKIPGQTCIPVGRYELKLRTFGRLYESYRSRYPWNEPGMLWLQAVPQFSDVLIHCGNTDKDTRGCLLLGDRADCARPMLQGSLDAYKRVYSSVAPRMLTGERCWLEIVETITAKGNA